VAVGVDVVAGVVQQVAPHALHALGLLPSPQLW
jgi:hypothetical protein